MAVEIKNYAPEVTRRPFTSTRVPRCAMRDLCSKSNLHEQRTWRKVSMKRKEEKRSKGADEEMLIYFLEGPPSPK